MDKYDILAQIHQRGLEFEVLKYLFRWAQDYSNRLEIENCHLRSSLDLIRKFNNEKWHIGVIDSLADLSTREMQDEIFL